MNTYEKYLNEEKDASVAYKRVYKSILKNLDILKKVLVVHSSRQAKDSSDWGYHGDLGYIDNELKELIQQLK